MSKSPKTPHAKRHGKHHKHSKGYVKVYAPYLPLFVSIIASVFLNFWQPHHGNTLAYATEMSVGGLLQATNSHRANSGVGALSNNSKLNSAAQAKANDMVARNYWSHNTPDGQEPWVFVQNAGYKYTKAGENLAYGFATSGDTVVGWMNSAAHKANMLDGTFTEVGFGFAQSANFNGDGPETVVVAMYGKPQILGASTTPTTAQPKAAPAAPRAAPAAPAPAPQPAPAPAPTPAPAAPVAEEKKPTPITTDVPVAATAPAPQRVAKVQTLTNGAAPWALMATSLVLAGAILFKLLHHSFKLKHLLHDSRRFILHHPLLDSTILGIAILGITLLRTVGTIL